MPRDLESYNAVSSRPFEIRILSEHALQNLKDIWVGFATNYSSLNMSHFIILDHLNPPISMQHFKSNFDRYHFSDRVFPQYLKAVFESHPDS